MHDLRDALAHNAARFGEKIAFKDNETRISWGELADLIGGAAEDLGLFEETIGIAGPNGVEWAIAFLAGCLAGKTIVPVPAFFSTGQLAALAGDAEISRVVMTGKDANSTQQTPAPQYVLPGHKASLPPREKCANGRLVIYTSGSTGQPKGVRLESGQAIWTAKALAGATRAGSKDKYLSLLPLPMLLEIICAIIIPVLVGGETVFEPDIAAAVATGNEVNLLAAFERVQPTMSVMVPQLLALYTRQLATQRKRPPEALRFAAVGGAPLPPLVAKAAATAGIPYFEGYGLSECASVVAVNRPGASRPGTAGIPLPGLGVEIDHGEIVVSGPPVMDGYLHGDPLENRWRTGDMGEIDEDGFLRIHGRRDNLIITPAGRNIAPEWIEAMLMGDPGIAACALTLTHSKPGLGMLIIPSSSGHEWFANASNHDLRQLVQKACEAAPAYARPEWALAAPMDDVRRYGLLASNGHVQRAALARYAEDKI